MADEKLTYEEWRDDSIKHQEALSKDYSEIDRYHRISNHITYLEMFGKEMYQEYLNLDESKFPIKIPLMDDKLLTNNKAVNLNPLDKGLIESEYAKDNKDIF